MCAVRVVLAGDKPRSDPEVLSVITQRENVPGMCAVRVVLAGDKPRSDPEVLSVITQRENGKFSRYGK